eukprot:gene7978-9485_t
MDHGKKKQNGSTTKLDMDETPPASAEEIREEAKEIAAKLDAVGISLLVIDTESKFLSTGFAKEIADAAHGHYYYLPSANDAAVTMATQQVISQLRPM